MHGGAEELIALRHSERSSIQERRLTGAAYHVTQRAEQCWFYENNYKF